MAVFFFKKRRFIKPVIVSVHDEVKLCQENNNFCKMVLFIVKGIKGVREMKKNSTGSKKEPKHPFVTISVEFLSS